MVKEFKGMRGFILIWAGQVFSMIGSQMTHFAMGIWAWEKTGQATPLALVGFFSFAPLIVFTPIAGVLVDRWNRKLVMALSDIGAGIVTVTIFILLLTDNLEIWHLYITGAVGGIFGAFQWPAYSAAITLLVDKKNYARTSGMISMAEFGVGIFAPILAGVLLPMIDVTGIIAIDLVTLVIALLFLLLVFIPEPEGRTRDEKSGAFFRELVYGFRYVWDRPSLFSLQLVFFFGNLFSSVGFTLFAPMILASTNGDSTVLGGVQSAGAVGGLVGGLALTAWGGPKKKIHGVLLGWILFGAFDLVLMGLGRAVPIWLAASFLGMLVNPMLNGSNQAIWQLKVSPEVQGRVFSVRRLIAQVTAPISMAVAGPLADNVFEPAMTNQDHWLGQLLGPIFGNAPGSGMSLLVSLSGLLVVSVGMIAYQIRQVRNVESLVPDHDQN
ncbi:MAG: MFS transporter [Brevefilum sp.]|nr:MFS transporter [Brevefilum sp.]MDW7755461.1 MFS transporter [Brevefilum sp.]